MEWKDILLVTVERRIWTSRRWTHCTSAIISFVHVGTNGGKNLVPRPDAEFFRERGLDHTQLDTLHICNPFLWSTFRIFACMAMDAKLESVLSMLVL